MTERTFEYQKKNGVTGKYRIYVLEDTDTYLIGLKADDLSAEDQKFLRERVDPLSKEEAQPFMSRFRRFSKKNIVGN